MNASDLPDEQLFEAALSCRTPAERAAFLDRACAGQPELRRQLEVLLAAHDRAGAFLEPAATPERPTLKLDLAGVEAPGTVIGRYKLLEKIGEGGVGMVYMAEQTEPIRRRVALKVIKLGMDTKQVVARFEVERQALALMDHPNIAKVLDAGATDTGRPFFVMELVRGIKITDYCDQNSLSTKERLDLFMQVCHAVQHAHQKGIIHRDLKPSNILVTLHDGVPVPKVIDFGIAKATQQPLTDKTLFTAFQQFVGTPAYMSPEQAELSGLDIDTRSDIYSLGVLLYELLTGKTPFEQKDLLQAGLDEMRRWIREKEPPRPSTRLSTLTKAELTDVAKHRGAEVPKLIPLVRGDLDWIAMKCIEKDRARRYETANGLATDIERHLHHQPVTAAAPGRAYRVGKFIRRHRYGVITAGAFVALLAVGVIASTWQAVRATRARNQAATISTFLHDTLTSVTPEQAKGQDTKLMLGLVDRAAARVDLELKDQPLTAAWLRDTLGKVYLDLGEYRKAEPLLQQALEARERLLGKEAPLTLISVNRLAGLLFSKGDYPGAEALHRRVLDVRERILGPKHADTLVSLLNLARMLRAKGEYVGAEPRYRRAVEVSEQTLGAEHDLTLASMGGLAQLLFDKGDYPGAEALHRRVLEVRERTLGPEHPGTLASMDGLAGALSRKGGLEEAESLYRRALDVLERTHGPDHHDTLNGMHNLATVLHGKKEYAEEETLYRRALEAKERMLGPEHPDTLRTAGNLAQLLGSKGNLTGAEPLLRQTVERMERVLGKEHPDTLSDLSSLADLVNTQGDRAEAERLYRQVLETREWKLGPDHPDTLSSLDSLATLLAQAGDYTAAEALSRRTLEARERTLGPEHPGTLRSVNNLGLSLKNKGDYAGAEPLFRRALDGMERVLGKEHDDTLRSLSNLASLLTDKGDLAAAESLLERALEAWDRTLGPKHPDTLKCVSSLADWHRARGDQSAAEKLCRRALEGAEETLGRDAYQTLASVNSLAIVLTAQEKNTEAERLFRRALEGFERTLGPDHLTTLITINNLGRLLQGKRDYTAAEPLLRRALAALERKLGPEHPTTLTSAANLGRVLHEKDDYAAAETQLQQVLQTCERALGPKHRDTLANVDSMGQLLASQGQHAAAALQFRRALEGREETLGKEHPLTLASVNNLANSLLDMKDYAAAEPLYRQALEGMERKLGKGHPETLRCLNNLARLLYTKGDYAAAEVRYREMVQRQRERLPPADPALAEALARWTSSLLAQGKFAEAEAPARECLDICEKKLPDDWLTLNARSLLGNSLLGQTKYAQAEPVLLRHLLALRQRGKEVAEQYMEAVLQRLVEVYAATGWSDAAASRFREAAGQAQPRDPELDELLRLVQGMALAKTNRLEEADQALSQAIEMAAARAGTNGTVLARALLERSQVRERTGRAAEARADFLRSKGIPPRPAGAKPNLIDLSGQYNVSLTETWHQSLGRSDLSEVPRGVRKFGGIEFDVRGLVQVGSKALDGRPYPKEVSGIVVRRRCQRLHFLHSAINAFDTPHGTEIGRYAVRYADGRVEKIPLVVGRDLADWFEQPRETPVPGEVVWTGTNESSRTQKRKIRLFKLTWENPRPEVVIETVAVVSTSEVAAPFVVAITGEPE